MLWLGLPECRVTWELEESLPQSLVQQFELGVMPASEIQVTPLYGHISGTVALSEKSEQLPEAKKKREERHCSDDLEGYVHLKQCVYTYNVHCP